MSLQPPTRLSLDFAGRSGAAAKRDHKRSCMLEAARGRSRTRRFWILHIWVFWILDFEFARMATFSPRGVIKTNPCVYTQG